MDSAACKRQSEAGLVSLHDITLRAPNNIMRMARRMVWTVGKRGTRMGSRRLYWLWAMVLLKDTQDSIESWRKHEVLLNRKMGGVEYEHVSTTAHPYLDVRTYPIRVVVASGHVGPHSQLTYAK